MKTLYMAASGTDVDAIRAKNLEDRIAFRNSILLKNRNSRTSVESFADGLITATWHQRGPTNEAGDMQAIAYDSVTNNIYALSTYGYYGVNGSGTTGRAGHLWKGNLNGKLGLYLMTIFILKLLLLQLFIKTMVVLGFWPLHPKA
jgi:hypothetical protein